jgi:hypothetical protein
MKVKESIQINAPASVVWQLVAHEFENVGKWASDVAHSEKISNLDLLDGADVSGRVCSSQYGDITEGFIHFDEAGMTFTYDAEGDAVPFFIKRTTNTWTVEATGEGACIVSFQPEVDFIPVVGILVQLPMQMFMRKVLNNTLEELKHYVETGTVHPRKAQAVAKILQKATA